jgi:hypothetical protein
MAIDWSKAAGPIVVELLAGDGPPAFVGQFQPWEVRRVPTTVDEIESFLAS